MSYATGVEAKLQMSGVITYRDSLGVVIKEVPFSGAIPLSQLGMTVEQAQELIQQQEAPHGPDHR